MQWTKEPPKLSGYYWAQIDYGAVPEVVEVEIPACDRISANCVWRVSSSAALTIGDFIYWSEKLQEPSGK